MPPFFPTPLTFQPVLFNYLHVGPELHRTCENHCMSAPSDRAALVTMRRVRDRIDREFASPLNLEELARGVHVSAGHLSREFRRVYGESPYSYLMTRRIERAMTLLRRGDLSVTEVCFAVGFASLGTFSTRFSELAGVSPSAYRRNPGHVVEGIPPCLAKQITRPIRNREVDGESLA